MPKALFILNNNIRERIYPTPVYEAIAGLVTVYAPPQASNILETNPAILQDMEFMFSGWSCPRIDADFLAAAPNLKMVFYGAGTIKSIVTDEFWQRGIRITTAVDANAIPVAQFTLAQIILSLKGTWSHIQQVKEQRRFIQQRVHPGLSRSTIGIIGLGMIGRHVCELLRPFDVDIIAYDPYANETMAQSLGLRLVDLETIFKEAHVVSLHAPWTPETVGMIRGEHFAAMAPYTSFINTARGALVREDEMIAVLRERPDLYALVDVTYPEPPPADSPLYDLPNVILTPHIAGAIEMNETRQLGETMLDELRRYLNGEALHWEVTAERLKTMA